MTEVQADYFLCNNLASIQSALADLYASPVLFIDCEGRDLGTLGGRLSVISIRTTGSETFIVDAMVGAQSLRPIFDILESNAIVKVMFDGRKDFCSFYHDFGVSLQNVIDLQLVDIQSRCHRFRGEREYAADRVQRLVRFLPAREILGKLESSYAVVQKLSGLGECIKEHGLDSPPKEKVNHTEWLYRPLSKEYLSYAAGDVRLIESLYDLFSAKGYIDSQSADVSIRYVSIWSDVQPVASDKYRANPLLPLDVLDHRSSESAIALQSCLGCSRDLPRRCFSQNAWKGGAVRRLCWVCRAVDVWRKSPWVIATERKREKERVEQQRNSMVIKCSG